MLGSNGAVGSDVIPPISMRLDDLDQKRPAKGQLRM
ncbi:unnamed protein product [Anisakis simplex]|uniref:Uncharacterized protein n=1 Tax=Anisakis simplex TaxID=6269 RepID=A0A0M3KIX1_ANISI|nr:unnamed protein product [Anisakis simplex]